MPICRGISTIIYSVWSNSIDCDEISSLCLSSVDADVKDFPSRVLWMLGTAFAL